MVGGSGWRLACGHWRCARLAACWLSAVGWRRCSRLPAKRRVILRSPSSLSLLEGKLRDEGPTLLTQDRRSFASLRMTAIAVSANTRQHAPAPPKADRPPKAGPSELDELRAATPERTADSQQPAGSRGR